MMISIPALLSPEQVRQCRQALDHADWVDGKGTAGFQSAKVKENSQLPEGHPVAQHLGQIILDALSKNLLFMSAALPARVFPPLFNRYAGGQHFGAHVDNAVRQAPFGGPRIRTDLSCTLFFSDPEEYEGGELVVEDLYGHHAVKLPAGHMVLYPSSSLHHVRPVTAGARVCSFFWLQSMVRDDGDRRILFDMDMAILALNKDMPDHPGILTLTNCYHNLLRRWVEV
ncbi:Fe2+-dependent dioxygenase [Niveispirillum lacus]|uniref:Fe2+-dependent dioxygenase n=1 Tax=Niveispirillum lacus TaxID=1981099 RepID=A0A255Z4B4_9PROT|nr:Fe2+-dependent dioxygenase [Niveispirillum lacus]OYQ35490.1 Fe2+-dependent dioxygenase [Niveispirillum lacus]